MAAAPLVVLPTVIAERVGTSSAEVDLVVPRDLHYFRGHFPSAPVVPGVVLIKWAIAFAQRFLRVGGGFVGMEAVKFQQPMTPELHVTLTLDYNANAGKLRFSFASAGSRYGSGRVLVRAL
jgi:3-hydroxymyristoyl/3-hydroxydecanoyl-(acyl carrier protein) dehydratase